jgi:hypothetical protein
MPCAAARYWNDRDKQRGSAFPNIFGNIVIVLSRGETEKFKSSGLIRSDGWNYASSCWNQYTYSVKADGTEAERKISGVKKLLGEPSKEERF